jgi:transcriptional regulator with XRE-family HTH domain
VGEPAGSRVTVGSLARRLRELRHSRFPGVKLTQNDLAHALAEEEPVAISTLSAWENIRTPTLPSHVRLSAYARFFATRRSLEPPPPHLVPVTELTPAEQQVRRELERELFRLRDLDADEVSSPPRSWRFEDGAAITIICSERPPEANVKPGSMRAPDNPNYAELLSYADQDALMALWGHLRVENPDADVRYCRASEANAGDLINHLVLLGGIAWNDITRRLNDSVGLPLRQVTNKEFDTGEVFEIQVGPNHGQQYLPRWRDDVAGTEENPGILLEDVAMLARLPNPFNVNRTLTYCNGIHSRGVLGAVHCLTEAAVQDGNERYLEETFHGSDRFAILMRVPVLGRQTIAPSLSNPNTVLFKWPDVVPELNQA